MESKNLKETIVHYKEKLNLIESLFNLNKLELSFDNLNSSDAVEQEILYFKFKEEEKKGIFVFGFDFFLKELNDHEIKRVFGPNYLNFLISEAYSKLCLKKKEVSVNLIAEEILKFHKNSYPKHKIFERILMLAYYNNWTLIRDEKAIDSDYLVVIPNNFIRIKQRFNLENSISIKENENYLCFINRKGDLIFVFKKKIKFTRSDVEIELCDEFKEIFKINNIVF